MKIIAIAIVLLVFVSCADKQSPQQTDNRKADAYTFATPHGSELLPAERGPVRNVFEPPSVDLETFRLTIDGLVSAPYSLSWQDILNKNAAQTDTMNMYCVEGWEVWGVLRGVSIAELLEAAVPQPEATHVMFHTVDGYSSALPIAYLKKYNAMLAYEVNGKSLGLQHGRPLRVVAFGLFGYKWAKYVNRMEVIKGTKLGFWERYGYDDKAIVPLERRKFYEGENARPIEY